MDEEYSPLPRKPLASSFTIWSSRHKILFPGNCSALTLFPSLTKLVEFLLLPTEMRSSVEGHRESILSRPTYFLRTRSVLSAKGFALPFCKLFFPSSLVFQSMNVLLLLGFSLKGEVSALTTRSGSPPGSRPFLFR